MRAREEKLYLPVRITSALSGKTLLEKLRVFIEGSAGKLALYHFYVYYRHMKIIAKISRLSVRSILVLCALVSVLLLATALVAQYGFGLHPCHLCIYQRIPYAIILLISLSGMILVKNWRGRYMIAVLCALLFLTDAGIAGYHAGVEAGVFKGPDACSNDGGGQTIEEIRAAIMNAPLVSCAQAMAYFSGLSMAAWNMIAALLACFCLSFVLCKNYKTKL